MPPTPETLAVVHKELCLGFAFCQVNSPCRVCFVMLNLLSLLELLNFGEWGLKRVQSRCVCVQFAVFPLEFHPFLIRLGMTNA